MKTVTRLLLAALPAAALVGFTGPAQAETTAGCEAVAPPEVPGATVLTTTGVERHDYEVPPNPWDPDGEPIPVPDFCEVVVTLTHPGAGDEVTVEVWLPLEGWNERFQGVGGAGFAVGLFDPSLAAPLLNGYAAASTDGGVAGDAESPETWALDASGEVNDDLLTNFASRSVHDMTVVGKAVTAWFYDRPASYSYWDGCSTGGRQGLMEAQRYPDDYDGINAAAPAIYWNQFVVADQWPQVVMQQEGNLLTQCELAAFNDAAIAACDRIDKVADGVIAEPDLCRYNPRRLVGTVIVCEGQEITISRADADVVAKIWDGPRAAHGKQLWFGLPEGAPFAGIAGTVTEPDGTVTGAPFSISDNWIKYFLKQDPTFDTTTITYEDYERLFAQSVAEYDDVLGTADPDLSDFRAAGGKMITWHGQADELIFPGGTVQYRERVARETGGRVDDYYRVFLAPGVGHCGFGTGRAPTDPLGALVAWVERGEAPEVLPAATMDGTVTRDLCKYPLVSRYDGHGDPNSADSYRCAKRF